MTDTPIQYSHLLGALLSSQVPYLFMIGCGFFFGKVGVMTKEGVVAAAKMNVEVFFPVYFFIQVCRSTFTYNFEKNFVIIISFLFYFVISFLLCAIYAKFTKMDLRYRFTFICITSMVDIKRLHYLYINSFCTLLNGKTTQETKFCENILVNSNIHVFFQGIIIWYLCFNLIRMDRRYQRQAILMWEKATKEKIQSDKKLEDRLQSEEGALNTKHDKEEKPQPTDDGKEKKELENYFKQEEHEDDHSRHHDDSHRAHEETHHSHDEKNENNESFTFEERKGLREIYEMYAIPTEELIEETEEIKNQKKPVLHVFARQSFYDKLSKYKKVKFSKSEKWYLELLYIILRSPLIGLFVGFVVGFIRVIRVWIYDTTTPVYLFFDTFNTIGNCNILLGFLIIGANISIKDEDIKMHEKAKIRPKDYIVHFFFKIVLLPFIGVIFSYVIQKKYYPENRVLNFSSFIQWILPTSLDVLTIVNVKNINTEFVSFCILVQFIAQMILNNLAHIPCFLKVIDCLSG